jgi:cell shape-determining protein MreC
MDWAVVIVAIISGGSGVLSSLVVARSTTNKLLNELKMQQALQDEKINNYQRVTNEKIDELRRTNQAQQEWGTRIALLEAEQRRIREGEH